MVEVEGTGLLRDEEEGFSFMEWENYDGMILCFIDVAWAVTFVAGFRIYGWGLLAILRSFYLLLLLFMLMPLVLILMMLLM